LGENKMHQSIVRLNEIFSDAIIENCRDKKVLLTLTGGVGSRAMLSILCKHGVHCDAITHNASGFPEDIKIAKKIAKDIECIERYSYNLLIFPLSTADEISNTTFNLRKRLLRLIHWNTIWVLEKFIKKG